MLQSPAREQGISLRELWPAAEFVGAGDIRVTACTGDSRACQPGDLFAALVGAEHDGHDFARQAAQRGAAAILAERYLPVDGLATCIVPDTRQAYGELCQALAGHPSRQLKVVGVTGTNGKTTTSHLIASVLEAAGYRAGLLGTLGYSDSFQTEPATLTTPSAPELATWLARMVANGCSHAVMEVSSHGLCQRRVAGMEFDSACVTNVRRDHLDYHGSPAAYRRAKARLFDHLSPDAFAVLNADDPGSIGYLAQLNSPALSIGIDRAAEVTARLVERFASEQTFLVTAGSETATVRTQMIGDHHISNCLMAAACGLAYGIDLPAIVRGLEAVGHIPGRLERVECGQPFGVFVDYAHTPDALAVALDTLRQVTAGRLICVFGAGGNRDAQKRPLMGRAVAERTDLAIITSDNPRDEDPQQIAHEIASGVELRGDVRLIADRVEAIHHALGQARADDCVLIAGKGHEDYQIIGGDRYPLDDCDVARRWLYNLEPQTARSPARRAYMAVSNS